MKPTSCPGTMSAGPQQGFTAMDFLVTLAVTALLVSLGAPAFRHWVFEQRMKAAVSALHADLALARNAAISRNGRTVACPAGGGGHCANEPQWHGGWLIFVDENGDREWHVPEPVLRRATAVASVSITSSPHRKRLRFFPNGTAPGSNANITFCDARGTASARQISLSASGRLRRKSPAESTDPEC